MENQPHELPWNALIKKERKQRSWTQAEVAEKIGVGVKTVARWERAESLPLPLHRRSLATIYEKSLHDLKLDEASDKESHQEHLQVEEKVVEIGNYIEKENQLPEITVVSPDTGQLVRFVVQISLQVPKTA